MAPTDPSPIYLDYNATAPLHPAAREAMLSALDAWPGNPSSPHAHGQAARNALEEARAGLAGLLGFARREVIFTSGGSESNTMVLRWAAEQAVERDAPCHVIVSAIEHPSVLESAAWLAAHGVSVDYLPVNGEGVAELDALEALIRPETRLISLMAANNETGVVQPVAELTARVRALEDGGRRVWVHCDAVQAFGRIPLSLREWGVDAVTVAAHKLGGPKGIGALALREGLTLTPLVLGGRQERGLRAGTESVFLARGFLAAAEWMDAHREELAGRLAGFRALLTERLAGLAGFFENGAAAQRLPNTVNLGFEGVPAQSLLVALDLRGVSVSTGSACSSGALEPSHVLQAMALPAENVESALRISMGFATTQAEVERCAEVIAGEVARLRGGRQGAE